MAGRVNGSCMDIQSKREGTGAEFLYGQWDQRVRSGWGQGVNGGINLLKNTVYRAYLADYEQRRCRKSDISLVRFDIIKFNNLLHEDTNINIWYHRDVLNCLFEQ